MTLTGYDAIEYAETHGLKLNKYADPTEGARYKLVPERAREIAAEDPSLIWIETDPTKPTSFDAPFTTIGPDGPVRLGAGAASVARLTADDRECHVDRLWRVSEGTLAIEKFERLIDQEDEDDG